MESDPATAERHRIASLELPLWCRVAIFLERSLFRLFRLLIGIGIVIGSIWLFNLAWDVLGKPFALLSPLGFLGGVLTGIAGLLLFLVAINIAFAAERSSIIEQNWREGQANQRRLLGYEE